MDLEISNLSAYHGKNWLARNRSHEEELQSETHWSLGFGATSEYEALKEVLLFHPGRNFPEIHEPDRWQFLRSVDVKELKTQFHQLKETYESLGIKVHSLEDHHFLNPSPNLLFCRDLFLLTPYGGILGRMGSLVRAGEEKWAQLALAQMGIPILKCISGKGLFEGADALWLDSHTLLVGIGNRTNFEAFLQIQNTLEEFKIQCVAVPLPKSVQHLLGLLQMPRPHTAFLRKEKAPESLIDLFQSRGMEIVWIKETEETVWKQSFNFVCHRPNHIIMAKNCPESRALFEKNGLTISAEVEISQYISAAGGIACATGILARELPFLRA